MLLIQPGLFRAFKSDRELMGWHITAGALEHAPRYKQYGLAARILAQYCKLRWRLESSKLQRRNKKYWESQGFEYKR